MNEEEMKIIIAIIVIVFSIIGIVLWIKTFFEIVKSDTIRLFKLILLIMIFFIPILAILYQIRALIKKGLIGYFKGISNATATASKQTFKLTQWLFGK